MANSNISMLTADLNKAKEFIWGQLQHHKADVILIFSDISGSTKLSGIDEKKYLLTCIHHFLEAQRKLSNKEKGISIVKTIGDEVMLSQVIVEQQNDKSRILLDLLVQSMEFQKELLKIEVSTKMAIHLCQNVYPLDKLALNDLFVHPGDVLGKEVNLAARIMSVANEGQLLISKKVFQFLPEELKKNAINGTITNIKSITEQTIGKIRFDLPMEFPFKGIEDPNESKAIQVVDAERIAPELLSRNGYKFKCVTLMELSNPNPTTINKVIKSIKDIFPPKSPMLIMKKKHGEEADKIGHHVDLAIIFQCYDFEHYNNLLTILKQENKDDILQTLTNPIWSESQHTDFYRNIVERQMLQNNQAYIVLFQCKGHAKSESHFNSFDRNNVLYNSMLMGHLDNFHLVQVADSFESTREWIKTEYQAESNIDNENIAICPVDLEINELLNMWSL